MSKPISLFISYAPEDKALMDALLRHLAPMKRAGKIEIWERGMLLPGANRGDVHLGKMNDSDIIVVLASSDYFGADSLLEEELSLALGLEKMGSCVVIPALLRECDYSYFESKTIIPRNAAGKVLPVTSWHNQDEALGSIVVELGKVVQEIRGEEVPRQDNNNYFSTPQSSCIKNTVDESVLTAGENIVMGDGNTIIINPPANPSSYSPVPTAQPLTLEDIWKEIPLKKGVHMIQEVLELNREKEFKEDLLKDFRTKTEADSDQNLCYFINCCQSHCPESIARRFVRFYKKTFIEYASSPNDFDEIHIFDLRISDTLASTWNQFWNELLNKMVRWRDFVKNQDSTPEQEFDLFIERVHDLIRPVNNENPRFPIILQVKANRWNSGDVDMHLSYIIEQFSRLPKGANKFVFLFLMDMPDLHNCICEESHPITIQHRKIESIRHRNFQSEISPHIVVVKLLNHISKTDIKNWLDALLDTEQMLKTLDAYYEMLLKALQVEMSENELKLYNESQCFQMDRLFIMQRHAYKYVK